jgi:hypothetical protein
MPHDASEPLALRFIHRDGANLAFFANAENCLDVTQGFSIIGVQIRAMISALPFTIDSQQQADAGGLAPGR